MEFFLIKKIARAPGVWRADPYVGGSAPQKKIVLISVKNVIDEKRLRIIFYTKIHVQKHHYYLYSLAFFF